MLCLCTHVHRLNSNDSPPQLQIGCLREVTLCRKVKHVLAGMAFPSRPLCLASWSAEGQLALDAGSALCRRGSKPSRIGLDPDRDPMKKSLDWASVSSSALQGVLTAGPQALSGSLGDLSWGCGGPGPALGTGNGPAHTGLGGSEQDTSACQTSWWGGTQPGDGGPCHRMTLG